MTSSSDAAVGQAGHQGIENAKILSVLRPCDEIQTISLMEGVIFYPVWLWLFQTPDGNGNFFSKKAQAVQRLCLMS